MFLNLLLGFLMKTLINMQLRFASILEQYEINKTKTKKEEVFDLQTNTKTRSEKEKRLIDEQLRKQQKSLTTTKKKVASRIT